ncbi:MAG: deoxyguanosinetriphosphate triphosphohydrolase [Oscillospiraceae bacterium]|nr:deoxyguanosinetriphosphate triphosphohydrolase [Oscillospiraceae bacterium]
MVKYREKREELEKATLSQFDSLSACSRGRERAEEECTVRTCFQRDIDRITHSKAFRRLKQKTQVFLRPENDHYRTRLTHTLEVSRIARTISRALELNEDLTEAVALGHDLGHTPFGHAGEAALNRLLSDVGGFRHYEQSLRVVERLEKDGEGLNLTWEVRDGILRHTNDPLAATLEGRVVRLADRIAYINHDIDDAMRAGVLREKSIPERFTSVLGHRYSQRIDTITKNVIENSYGKNQVVYSPDMHELMEDFHDFMFENVYRDPVAKREESKVDGIISGIFNHYLDKPEELPPEYLIIAFNEGLERAVGDYVSGMTDEYAVSIFTKLFVPAPWTNAGAY